MCASDAVSTVYFAHVSYHTNTLDVAKLLHVVPVSTLRLVGGWLPSPLLSVLKTKFMLLCIAAAVHCLLCALLLWFPGCFACAQKGVDYAVVMEIVVVACAKEMAVAMAAAAVVAVAAVAAMATEAGAVEVEVEAMATTEAMKGRQSDWRKTSERQ